MAKVKPNPLKKNSTHALSCYDGEHPRAMFSVSTGVKIRKKNIKEIKYFIAKFAFKLDKRASMIIINKIDSLENIQNFIFIHRKDYNVVAKIKKYKYEEYSTLPKVQEF